MTPGTPEYDAALASLTGVTSAGQMEKYNSNLLFEMTKRGDYLARLALQGSSSDLVKDDKIAKGNYAFITSKESFIDLGPSVDIMPFVWRSLALDISSKPPLAVYDETSPMFMTIMAKSKPGMNLMCMWGPQFLVWIPKIEKFAGLHLNSATNRPCGTMIDELKNKGVTLTWSKRTNDAGQKWEGIVVNPCTTPFAIPDLGAIKTAIDKFNAEALEKPPEPADVKKRDR